MYYSRDNIDLIQLSSFQYYNAALTLYQDKKVEEAIPYTLKGYKLNPSTKNEFLKISLISEHLHKSNLNGPQDIVYLSELGNSLKDESVRNNIINTFESYIYPKLFKNSNDSILIASYKYLESNLKDSLLRKEITQRYNIGFTEWYKIKGKYDESLRYAKQAYQFNPNDAVIQEHITAVILKRTASTIGSVDNLTKLTEYLNEYPFLEDNPFFRSLFASNYAYLAYKNFETDNESEGYGYLAKLEDVIEKLGEELAMPEGTVALVFAEAGAHHYRKKEYKKAKEIMLKGFKYAPNDEELKARIEIVEKELN